MLKQRLSSEEERRGKMMDAYEMQVGREREREDGAVVLIKPKRIITSFNITGVLCVCLSVATFFCHPTAEEAI